MRCFIAIDTSDQIKAALASLQRELAEKANAKKPDVKWVDPELIHMTLKFLGEVKDAKIAEICNIVKKVTARHERFELDIQSVGYFGRRSAKVIWVGTGSGSDNLVQLQKDLDEQLALAHWPPESREFVGHLTVCRVRNPKAGVRLAETTESYKDFSLGTMAADSMSVYKSDLTSSGPIYTVLANCKLK